MSMAVTANLRATASATEELRSHKQPKSFLNKNVDICPLDRNSSQQEGKPMPNAPDHQTVTPAPPTPETFVKVANRPLTAQEGQKSNRFTSLRLSVFRRTARKALFSRAPTTERVFPPAPGPHLPLHHVVRPGKSVHCPIVTEPPQLTRRSPHSLNPMFDAMHPPLNCHNIAPFPAQDMVSAPPSFSNSSSTHSTLKGPQLLQTPQNTHTSAYEDAGYVQPKFSVINGTVLPPCACEEAEGSQAIKKYLPLSTGHLYGAGGQIRVEGLASVATRQLQQLRHPPESWTGEISQETCFHHEEASTRRASHTGSDGKILCAQAPEELVEEQIASWRRHQDAFESEKNKVKGPLVTQDMCAMAEAAVNAAVANQVNPLTHLSCSYGERAACYMHQTQEVSNSKPCTSNLLRSLSADATEKNSFAQTSSKPRSYEDQLGIAGTQKPRPTDFWTAAGSICKSPSALRKPSQLAEKSGILHRAAPPSVEDAMWKGEQGIKGKEQNLKCGEEQKNTSDARTPLGNCFAEGPPFQNEHSVPPRKISLQPCHAQWRVRSGQSPVAFSHTNSERTITRPTAPPLYFPGAAEPPQGAESYSSNSDVLSMDVESKPHILVRSYRTFYEEYAMHSSLRRSGRVAEGKAQQNYLTVSAQKQDPVVSGDPCVGATFESKSSSSSNSSGSQCEEASRGIQKQSSPIASHCLASPLVWNTQPLGEREKNCTRKQNSNNEHSLAEVEHHLAAVGTRGTASRVSRRNPQQAQEEIGVFDDINPVLPHRLVLKRLLGSGAMGHVYLVELHERPYAVKIALQSDPAACMYLRQGWRNLVHLEKIYQRRQRQAAPKQTNGPTANCSYTTDTEQNEVLLRDGSASRTSQQEAAHLRGLHGQDSGRTTAVEGPPDPQPPNEKGGRKGKHSIERGVFGRRRENSQKEPDSRMDGNNIFTTIQAGHSGSQHDDAQKLLSLHHPINRDIKETRSQQSIEAAAEEEMGPASFQSLKHSEKALPVPAPASTETSRIQQIFGARQKSGEGDGGKASHHGDEVAKHGKIFKAQERERYFCRPVAFLEGEWFRFEGLQENETAAAPAAAANLTKNRLLRVEKACVEQKLPPGELLAVHNHATAGDNTNARFASRSSRNSSSPRKHKQDCPQAAGEEHAVTSGGPVSRVPVCAYMMEYIPDACQLTAVIWNLHRCLDPSHALRRNCHNSIVGQRLVEIGLCVAEAHKFIAAEAGLYSFDFNPKNILVCVVPRGGSRREDTSPPPPGAGCSDTKKVVLPSGSSASPLAVGHVVRTGTRTSRRPKEEAKTLCKAAPFRYVEQTGQQQAQQQRKRQHQQQQQMLLHVHQQQAQQQQAREQQCRHTSLSPADITRLVLCNPQVHFRVVAIDLDCSLQAPFSSSAESSSAANVITSSTSASPPKMEDVLLGPLLDWSCGRRVVYSCPHVSSITAAYIVAVLAKNKGEGQFTRSGLSEAAAHAALCYRIDNKDNFLHYLWAPSEKVTSRDSEDDEQVKVHLREKKCVTKVDSSTKISSSHPDSGAQATVRISRSSEHVPSCEVEDKKLDARSSSRTQAKEKRAGQQGDQGLVERRIFSFPNSGIPAEASTPTHAPAQKRPAPAAREPYYCSSLLHAYRPSSASPTKHKCPSRSSPITVPSRPESSPKLISASNERLDATVVTSSNSTEERGACLKPQMLPLADSSKRSCTGKLAGTIRELMMDRSRPDVAANSNGLSNGTTARSNNNKSIRHYYYCTETGNNRRTTIWSGATRGEKGHSNTRKDVLEACSCSCTLHASNTATAKPLEVSTGGQPAALGQQQLHLPCFVYPRWGPKTPRGISQREYSNYGVRLVGQHVNLQLLSFILCELLDFRSLHVVVLQRFGIELRALNLPTGICQMFSEQDQIISCLCFSALTRMTSAVVPLLPPLRFFSLQSAEVSPALMLRLSTAEQHFCLTQQRSVVPLSFDAKAAGMVCGCQEVLKLEHDSRVAFGSSQQGRAGDTDEKRRIQRSDPTVAAVAKKDNRHHGAAPTNEKCCIAGPAFHELLLKDSTLISSAGNCPAVLLLQRQNTHGGGIMLLPGIDAESRSCASLLKGCTGSKESQNVLSTTRPDNSVNSSSFVATGWRTCIVEHQGQRELLNSGKGERQRCVDESSPRREAGKKEVGHEGDGDTQTTRTRPSNHSRLHIGSIPLCVHRRRSDYLSRHEELCQNHHLSAFASCYTIPTTASQRKVRLAARESATAAERAETATGLGTTGTSGAVVVARALAAKTGLRLKQKQQPRPSVESPRGQLQAKCVLSSSGREQQHQEEALMKTAVKTQRQQEVHRLTEGPPFGVSIGSQRPDGVVPSYSTEIPERANISKEAGIRIGPVCPASLVMLRRQQQLQQEHAQQEQQQKVRRLLPEEVSRMSVWDKVEHLPALNPHDFLPPLHLFGASCMQEVAALNAVLLQFLDPHPFFTLRYSSSTSAFDSIIHALRQLRRRLASFREDMHS